MQFDSSKLREYIQLLDTIGKDYDFEFESASFFQIDKIKPELFIKKDNDEKDSLTIINALLEHDVMPEYYYDYTKKSLIELAIKEKCSIPFIKELIDMTSKYNLDVVGVASSSFKLMVAENYPFEELFEIISKFFEYGYNYLNSCEVDALWEFKISRQHNILRLAILINYAIKKGYSESKYDDLLFMYKNTGVTPRNIVNYLFSNVKDYDDDKVIKLICSFFKCGLDSKEKILDKISEINFKISEDDAQKGLKIVLRILLREKDNISSVVLNNLYNSLLIQQDIELLINTLNKFITRFDFDMSYYKEVMLNTASNILKEQDFKILKENILKMVDQIDKNKKMLKEINKKIDNQEEKNMTNDVVEEFQDQGRVLNNVNYISMPGVGRDAEMEKVFLGLARRNGSVVLVGESGVGKTEIANRLAWQIQNNYCPQFLKDRIIIEVSLNSLIAGSIYRGSFEEKMEKFFKKTRKYNAIVVINEIHNVFGLGSTSDHDFDLSEMLKTEIEKGNIQIIGTTTEDEYTRYFANNALKRRFKKVEINELDEGLLYSVFEKHINDLCGIYNVTIDKDLNIDKVINILINYTKKRCRVYNDRENNPALGISIIEDAFAYMKVYNNDTVIIDDFIYAFKSQDRIYESSKANAINELEYLKTEKAITRKRANIIDISSLKKY